MRFDEQLVQAVRKNRMNTGQNTLTGNLGRNYLVVSKFDFIDYKGERSANNIKALQKLIESDLSGLTKDPKLFKEEGGSRLLYLSLFYENFNLYSPLIKNGTTITDKEIGRLSERMEIVFLDSGYLRHGDFFDDDTYESELSVSVQCRSSDSLNRVTDSIRKFLNNVDILGSETITNNSVDKVVDDYGKERELEFKLSSLLPVDQTREKLSDVSDSYSAEFLYEYSVDKIKLQ